MSAYTENFESIVIALIESASSGKAVAFVERLASQIRAHGDAWIASHVDALHIRHNAAFSETIAPVADNRLFFLGAWQVALAA